jgi:hypothetical protein
MQSLLLLLVVASTTTLVRGQGCHPGCIWECDSPICYAVCSPICDAPACITVGCSSRAPQRCSQATPSCWTSCPPDQCQVGCPECETICVPPLAFCESFGCAIECPETSCAWDCKKPTNCREPVCELQCNQTACMYSAASSLSPWLALLLVAGSLLILQTN